MSSTDHGSAMTPRLEGVETVSPVIPAPAAPTFEKCAACGTVCRPSRSPQLLPCLHSVCKVCVAPVGAEERKRECPNCKRHYDILEVTDNPLLKDSTTGQSTQRLTKCAGCEDSAISGWCVECGEALCSICVSAHQRVRVTREHTVLPQKLPTGFIPTLYCPIHREEAMKLFCVSCNQLTCRDCQLTYHRNHSYQFLNEAVTAQREQIESLMVKVRQQRAVVKQTLLDLDGRLQDLEEIKSKAKSKLQKVLVYIRCALMKRTTELFKIIQDLCGSEAHKLTERQNDLKSLEERQEYILSFAERALQMENHSALLSCKRQVQSQLLELLSQCATPPASMIDVRLHFEQQAYGQIAKMGEVVSNEVPFVRKDQDAVAKKSSVLHVPRQNVHPAPSSYQPYSSTLPATSPSPSPLASPQTASVSVSPSQSSVTAVSTVMSQSPLASVSRPSTAASSLPPVYSCSSSTPPPPYHTLAYMLAPSASLSNPPGAQSLLFQQRRGRQTWSFHPYRPKDYKPADQQPNACSPQPPQQPARVSPPAESQPPPAPVSPAVLSLRDLNGLDTCPGPWNPPAVQTAKPGPAAVPPGPRPGSLPAQPAELAVKAPADSPCERAPPAGCERTASPSPPATENEPTSTVRETDAAPPAGLPRPRGALTCRIGAGSSSGVPAARGHEDAVTAGGGTGRKPPLRTYSRRSVGAPRDPHPQAASFPPFSLSRPKLADVRVRSCPQPHHSSAPTVPKNRPIMQISNQNSSKPTMEPEFQPVRIQHKEGKVSGSKTSDSKSLPNQQAPPSRAGPITLPVRPLERCNTLLPTSFKEILEIPSNDLAFDDLSKNHPLLRCLLLNAPNSENVPPEQAGYRGSPVETEKADDDDEDEDNFGPEPENEEAGGPVCRLSLPLVSVMRLPVSVPPSGKPLPQFRLLPGATEDEILLQMIEDDESSDSQSSRAAKKRPATHLSNQTKAKLIVLRGPIANPTQSRMSPERSNHCSAQQPPSKPEGSSVHRAQSSHKPVQLRCAACRIGGGLSVCSWCGRGFHRDCHIPPLSSDSSSADWQCMLCRDLSDVGDLYNDERPKRPSLSLPDQRKCEHLLLALMCKKYSSVLYHKIELSSNYIDITLIRGRLLRKLSPPYRTPSEFVSDIWVLLETLSKSSVVPGLVFKMQKYFQRKLSKTFGDTLHPSLLKCPSTEDGDVEQDAGDETSKVRETLKRMREFLAANSQALTKRVCKDGGTEPKEKEQDPS